MNIKSSFKLKRQFQRLKSIYLAKFNLFKAQYSENDEQIILWCTNLLDNYPNSYNTLCDRAESFRELKNYENALNDLDHAVFLKPFKERAWCLRGIVKSLQKSYVDAIGDLDKVIEINPKSSLAYKWRAFCYYMMKCFEEALSDLNLAIKFGPADAFTYINRADVNRELRLYENSKKDIEMAFKFKSDRALAYGTRGVIHLDNGRYQEAVRDLNKVNICVSLHINTAPCM